MNKYTVVITTTGSEEQAEKLADVLLTNKLAACIQLQSIKSFYTLKGERQTEAEVLLFIKTRSDKYQELQDILTKNHPYETPEIIELPISNGNLPYLQWIDKSLK